MAVSDEERQQINSLVGRFEARTGIQAVAAVVGRADAYPEIPWKAFAIGSALGVLAAALFPVPATGWNEPYALAFEAMAMLGAGAALAAVTIFVPAAARVFLDRLRAQGEIHQYALSMFLERELYRTSDRCAVLVLVGQFERAAVIVSDSGLSQCLPVSEVERIAGDMQPWLRRGDLAGAFESAFAELQNTAERHGRVRAPTHINEIQDAVVTDKGV